MCAIISAMHASEGRKVKQVFFFRPTEIMKRRGQEEKGSLSKKRRQAVPTSQHGLV
jgi:hypothetical protein